MKKTYFKPHMDVVKIEVNKNLMLVVSNTEVNGNQALAPEMSELPVLQDFVIVE